MVMHLFVFLFYYETVVFYWLNEYFTYNIVHSQSIVRYVKVSLHPHSNPFLTAQRDNKFSFISGMNGYQLKIETAIASSADMFI